MGLSVASGTRAMLGGPSRAAISLFDVLNVKLEPRGRLMDVFVLERLRRMPPGFLHAGHFPGPTRAGDMVRIPKTRRCPAQVCRNRANPAHVPDLIPLSSPLLKTHTQDFNLCFVLLTMQFACDTLLRPVFPNGMAASRPLVDRLMKVQLLQTGAVLQLPPAFNLRHKHTATAKPMPPKKSYATSRRWRCQTQCEIQTPKQPTSADIGSREFRRFEFGGLDLAPWLKPGVWFSSALL